MSSRSDGSASARQGLIVICPDVETLINGYEDALLKLFNAKSEAELNAATISAINEDTEKAATSSGCQYIRHDQVASRVIAMEREVQPFGMVAAVKIKTIDGTTITGATFVTMLAQNQPQGSPSQDPQTPPNGTQEEPAQQSQPDATSPQPATASILGTQVIPGRCDATSNTAKGPINGDLTKQSSRFFCDTAVVTFFADYKGHVLVDFTQKKSQHVSLLGFAGKMDEDGIMMQVDNVYLSSGDGTAISDGACEFFYQDQHISNIACGMELDEGDHKIAAIVQFHAAAGQ